MLKRWFVPVFLELGVNIFRTNQQGVKDVVSRQYAANRVVIIHIDLPGYPGRSFREYGPHIRPKEFLRQKIGVAQQRIGAPGAYRSLCRDRQSCQRRCSRLNSPCAEGQG
jgi:hypothetical protein